MGEIQRMTDLSARVLTGDPWHAGSIKDLLADVTATDAVAKPVAGAHSIWELVLHMTGWADEVRSRLDGRAAGAPLAGDWPRVGRPTAARWAEARAGLFAAYRRLDRSLAALSDRDLRTPVTDHRDNAAGTGLSRYLTAHGIIHHAVYHAGQIAVLKRALRS